MPCQALLHLLAFCARYSSCPQGGPQAATERSFLPFPTTKSPLQQKSFSPPSVVHASSVRDCARPVHPRWGQGGPPARTRDANALTAHAGGEVRTLCCCSFQVFHLGDSWDVSTVWVNPYRFYLLAAMDIFHCARFGNGERRFSSKNSVRGVRTEGTSGFFQALNIVIVLLVLIDWSVGSGDLIRMLHVSTF